MKKSLGMVHNTLGLVWLKRKNVLQGHRPASRRRSSMDPTLHEARMNLAALSLNYRDYPTAEENFRAVLKPQPNNYDAAIGLGVALRGNRKFDEAEQQYLTAQKLNPQGPDSYFNLGLLYQEYKGMDKAVAAEGPAVLPGLPRPATRCRPEAAGGGEAHQGHRRHDGCPGRGRQAAERGRGDAEARPKQQQKKMEEQMKKMQEQEKQQQAAAAAPAAAAPAPAAGAAARGRLRRPRCRAAAAEVSRVRFAGPQRRRSLQRERRAVFVSGSR